MKRLYFILLAALSLAACDKGDDTSAITGYDRDQLNQTLYANQTGSGSGFTFTAAQSWTTQVADATRAAATWVTIDPPHGGAGTFTLNITLTPNLTGKDRTATIRIVCGDTTITITVEQKGTTEEGDEPQPEVPVTGKLISRIDMLNANTSNTSDVSGTAYCEFKYDAKKRLVEMRMTETESNQGVLQKTWVATATITHGTNTTSYTIKERVNNAPERMLAEATAQLTDGRITSCSRNYVDYDKAPSGVAGSESFTMTYDNQGRLAQTRRTEDDGDVHLFAQTWANGNYTQVQWAGGAGLDKAIYENSNYKNIANLDLNAAYILNCEGFVFSFGEQEKIFTLCGYTGKRSALLATQVTSTWQSPYNTNTDLWKYRYELNADGSPIKIHIDECDPVSGQAKFTETYVITYQK